MPQLQALDSDLLYGTVVPTSKLVSSPVGHTWEWMDDSGSFMPYQEDIDVKLNKEYGNDPINGAISFRVGKHSYVLISAQCCRPMCAPKCSERLGKLLLLPPLLPPLHSFLLPLPLPPLHFSGTFSNHSPYTPSESQAIEEMYQAQVPPHTTINGRIYIL